MADFHGHKVPLRVQESEVVVEVQSRPKRRNWAPFTLRLPFLFFIIVALQACTIGLEFLLRKSAPLPSQTPPSVQPRQVASTTGGSTSMAPHEDYGSLTSTTSSTVPVPTKTDSGAYGRITSTTSSSPHFTVSAAAPSNYGSLTSVTSSTSIQASTIVGSAAPSLYGSLARESTVVVVTHSSVSIITTNGNVIQTTIFSTSSSTSIKPTHTTTSSSPDILAGLNRNNVMVEGTFTPVWYFAALYLPSIFAVLIKQAWSTVGSSAKLMEPFYRMNRPGGATAAEALCSEYLGSALSWSSIRDALTGNLHLLIVIVVDLMMSMLAPLATESMTVDFLGNGIDAKGKQFRADPRWFISPPLVHGLQAVLSFVSACVAILIFLSLKRCSGIAANPSTIASMATLLGDPDVVHEIGEIDPNASIGSTSKMVANRHYALAEYVDANGHARHGLLRTGDVGFRERRRMLAHTTIAQTGPVAPQELNENDVNGLKRGSLTKIIDALLVFFIVGLLGVTIAYWIDGSDSGFNQYFNSEQFGPRFLLSTGASFITLGIQSIEHEVRIKTPYRRLAQRYAPASNTILRKVNGTALTNLTSYLMHQDWFGFLVALTAVLGNVLIIAVAGIPYSSAAILPAFYASVLCTIVICVLMLIVVVWSFVWRNQNYKLRIPREPNNVLIRVLMGLCNDNNRLRAMFDRLDDTSDKALQRHCDDYDRRYWAGWVMDPNGRLRWCVELEAEAVWTR